MLDEHNPKVILQGLKQSFEYLQATLFLYQLLDYSDSLPNINDIAMSIALETVCSNLDRFQDEVNNDIAHLERVLI